MKAVYRVFAYLIALEVAIQASAVALAVFGLGTWVDNGGTLDKATMESSDAKIDGVIGFAIHGTNGMMIVPLIALLFLIVSFFAKVPGGVKWAGITFLLVVVQVALGIFAHAAYQLGALHGLNALLLFGVAVTAGRRVRSADAAIQVPAQEPSRV